MTIFYYIEDFKSLAFKKKIKKLSSGLKNFGFNLITSFDEKDETKHKGISKADLYIINLTPEDPHLGYFLATAMLSKKPILCLYSEKTVPEVIYNYLPSKKIPQNLTLSSFSLQNIDKKIYEFIENVAKVDIEIPSIKFTLRITDKIDKYLLYKSSKLNKSKAEYLRDLINNQIKSDKKYKKN